MSFPSCIKIPTSKNNAPTETNNHNGNNEESVTYDELMSVANEVFGNGQWSHSITSQTIDYVEYVMGKYLVGCAAFIRVQNADGVFHEALGYANTESTVKGAAIFSARTLSMTQALKKALLCFAGAMEERINRNAVKAIRAKERVSTSNRERIDKAAAKAHTVKRDNCTKENTNRLSSVDEIRQLKESAAEQQQSDIVSKRNKSPRLIETDATPPLVLDVRVAKTECPEPVRITSDHNSLLHKDRSPVAITDEEIRLERKRKQKQKQEEYKTLMREKNMKSTEKPSPRY